MESTIAIKKTKPNIIVSRCLLGEPCRYDKSDKFTREVDVLKAHVNFISICPEMDCGLPVPRETVGLVCDENNNIKMLSNVNHVNLTNRMNDYLDSFFEEKQKIEGAILKSKSPSCGHNTVALFDEDNALLSDKENGLFTMRLIQAYPDVPIIDEKRIKIKSIREIFCSKIYGALE